MIYSENIRNNRLVLQLNVRKKKLINLRKFSKNKVDYNFSKYSSFYLELNHSFQSIYNDLSSEENRKALNQGYTADV